jgi:pimeloyl-ACP methyl ester carboxylesterase
MPFTTNSGVRIHWEQQGVGSPLLLIMGHKYSAEMWWPVRDALVAKHQVVWFDNRGTGQSQAPRTASVAEMVSDALAVMDAARLDSAHVWGVSMGGGIAQQLAITAPERVRSLILGCTAIKTAVVKAHPHLGALLIRLPAGLLKLIGGNKAYPNVPAEIAARDYEMMKKDKFSVPGVVAQHIGISEFTMTLQDAAGISVPTLVQHGTADPLVPYAKGQEIAATIPGARLSTYEGAAHNYLLMDIARVEHEALDFLAEIDSPAATANA